LLRIEEIRLDQGNRIGANAVELGLEQPRFTRGRSVVEHDAGAGACSRRQIAAPTRLPPPVISTILPCTPRPGITLDLSTI
jgi:hypothetical protein